VGVVATRRELGGSPVVLLINRTDQRQSLPMPEGTDAALDPETGQLTPVGDELTLEPHQTLVAVSSGATEMAPPPATPCQHEIELGEAEFRLQEPNLWAAAWELQLPDTDEWVAVDGLRFPPEHTVPPGKQYRLRWRFRVDAAPGELALVTEDLGEACRVTLNGQPVADFAPARVWDWLNLSAEVGGLVRRGENELVLETQTPAWDGPHAPPLTALRGDFAVLGKAMAEPVTRLGPGSWADQGYPNYVGTAEYRWECQLPPLPGPVFVAADDVAHVAALVVNGHRLPARLWPPYRFEVSEKLREGPNELVLEVTSTSANLLGLSDAGLLLNGAAVTARAQPLPAGLLLPLRLRW
jgi:hypothetical protein